MIDISTIRKDFPALKREINGKPIIYLDSAATYLKPVAVIDSVVECYQQTAGTIGRAVHVLAEDATARFDEARENIADFINADADEIIFVKNATEAINLVAKSLPPNQTIIGSTSEHHSNLLPWRTRHEFHGIPLDEEDRVNLEELSTIAATVRPNLVSFSTIGNAFGTVQPVERITETAHEVGADVMLDLSQSVAHRPIDVRKLNCEYACFSSHKLGGPTGVGVLFAKRDRLEKLQPMILGGGTVDVVNDQGYTLADTPMRLEAGTPSFEAVIGLSAACDYLSSIGLDEIYHHEHELTELLLEELNSIPRITIRGQQDAINRGAIVSFQIDGLESHGAARMLSNRANLCLRSGFHCAELAHVARSWRPTIRASLGVYNTADEVDVLVDSLKQIARNLV